MSNKLKKYLILILLSVAHISFAQDCDEESLINNYRKNVRQELQLYGRVRPDDETRESFYLLVTSLSVEALKKYTADTSPYIRSWVYGALLHKNADEKILREILAEHRNDTAGFEEGDDAVVTWNVRDFMQYGLDLKIRGALNIIDYQASLECIQQQPKWIIPGCHHNVVNRDSLLRASQLTHSRKECRIISFRLLAGDKEVSVSDLSGEEVKEIVRNLNNGEWFFIDDIRAECEGKRVKLPSLQLKITDKPN